METINPEELVYCSTCDKQYPRKDMVSISHGDGIADACQGMSAHGYLGVEGQAVAAIAKWVFTNVPPSAK